MKRLGPVLVVVLSVLGAGCSSGSSDGASPTTTKAPGATSSTATAPTTAPPAAEPLQDQTAPPSINGIAVQGDTIWVASIKGDQILQVRRTDGKILQRFDTGGAGPDDVAIAPDGSIWSTGFVNGDVGRIRKGSYTAVVNIAPGINPIDFTPDGTLYIGTYGPKGTLYRVPTDGSDPEVVIDGELPDINAFAPIDHHLLVAPGGGLTGPGAAVLIDLDRRKATSISSGTAAGPELPLVAAATLGPKGKAYLLGNITGEVVRVDIDDVSSGGRAVSFDSIRTVGKGAPFDNLSFAPDGTLYLSSFVAATITEVKPDGTTRVISIGTAKGD